MKVLLSQTRDDIWIAHDEAARTLGSFYDEGDGWWRANLANGTGKRLWVPGGDQAEVARRLFRGPPVWSD